MLSKLKSINATAAVGRRTALLVSSRHGRQPAPSLHKAHNDRHGKSSAHHFGTIYEGMGLPEADLRAGRGWMAGREFVMYASTGWPEAARSADQFGSRKACRIQSCTAAPAWQPLPQVASGAFCRWVGPHERSWRFETSDSRRQKPAADEIGLFWENVPIRANGRLGAGSHRIRLSTPRMPVSCLLIGNGYSAKRAAPPIDRRSFRIPAGDTGDRQADGDDNMMFFVERRRRYVAGYQ